MSSFSCYFLSSDPIKIACVGLSVAIIVSCAGGGGGSGGGGSGSTSLIRSFSSGANPVAYTAVVNLPNNSSGAKINVGAIGAQTGFQYFNNNIATAISSHAAAVVFPTGNYTIMPEGGNQYHIVVNGATDLTIDGQGSTLTFQGVLGGLSQGTVQGITINSGTRVVFKNFIIDYDVRIASSGTVQSESAHCSGVTHKYMAVNTGTYPMTDTRIQQAKIFNDSTSNLWGLRANEFYTYSSPVALTGGNAFYPCSASFDSAFPTVGHTITVRHFAYDGNAFGIYGSSSQDITIQGITVYASPAMGLYASNIKRGIAVRNFSVIKNPSDSTRLITLAADGLHFDQVGGDIIVENSEISYQGDDGLNIVSPITSATTVSGNQITITNSVANGFANIVVGDTFAFYSPSFSLIGSGSLQSMAQTASTVASFNSLAGVVSGDWMIDQSASTARVYISGNNFHDNRERGVLAHPTGMYLAANTFTNNSGPAILLATDGLSFNEGAFAKDVSIQGNTISASNQTQASAGTYVLEFAAISAGVECPSGSGCTNTLSPMTALLQNIAVINNTISTTAGFGIFLSNLTTASVSGNTVTDTASTVLQSSFGGAGTAAGSVHYTRSSGVSIGSNTLSRVATNN